MFYQWIIVGGEVTVHPVALKVSDVPWAKKSPDAAFWQILFLFPGQG